MHKLAIVIFCLLFITGYAQEQATIPHPEVPLQNSILDTYIKANKIDSPETLIALEMCQVPAAIEIVEAMKSASEKTAVEKQSISDIPTSLPKKLIASEPVETTAFSSGSASVAQKGLTPRKMRVRLTFYSGQDDQWGSKVAWRAVPKAERGRTVAADPSILPYGTWLHIPGFGKMRVEDTGTAVKARTASGGQVPVIDVYVGSESEVSRLSNATPEYVSVWIYDHS